MSTYKNFTVATDADGIALVTWDMPGKSMNVFTEEVMDDMQDFGAARTMDEVFAADTEARRRAEAIIAQKEMAA